MNDVSGVTTTTSNRQPATVRADTLISFISQCTTNIGRATFYNMKEDQQQAMVDQHTAIMEACRPFYTLMSLPAGTNDVNRQLIAFRLIEHTLREPGLKDHQISPITRWENEVILQALDAMPVTRVFDFFGQIQSAKLWNHRVAKLAHEWLKKNRRSLELWSIKYRTPLKRFLRHFHSTHRTRGSMKVSKTDVNLKRIWRYLKYNEHGNCGELIKNYVAVQNGDQDKLAKLPSSVAEGFMSKFGLSKDDFWKLFSDKGGKFTTKEKKLKANSVKKAGSSTGLDIKKLKLFDLLVYLKAQKNMRDIGSTTEINALLKKKAKEIASKIPFTFKKVGLVMDTSQSMRGTNDQPFHPMLKAMAVSLVMEQISDGFKEYRTGGGSGLFPKLTNQSNYADSLVKALKDGCETIIFAGDGYENSPFEGAVHQILFTLKRQIDTENKVVVLHMNPVFAAESGDVRPLSELASYVGVRELEAINDQMFLAMAKNHPMKAMAKYLKHLSSLQSGKAKELMPDEVKVLVQERRELIDA